MKNKGASFNVLKLLETKEIKELQTYNCLEKYWVNKDENKITQNFKSVLSKVKSKKKVPEWDKT